jgi:ABC-type Fe3+-hydroxamate transport system substrate-binding protein
MPVYTDQIGKEIYLDHSPKRIVSLVPSQTELLFDLGLDTEVVGITKFCVHPDQWFRSKTRIGGTKQIHLDKVYALSPDLIIANKEENLLTDVEALQNFAPVWTSDIQTITQALHMIDDLGAITNRSKAAASLIQKITADLLAINKKKPATIPVAYLIWKDPYMTVGGDTFINHMLEIAGFQNVFRQARRYPEISIDELAGCGAKLVLLSSEPYPFAQKHIDALEASLPNIKCLLVDGEMFSWYGSRMQHFNAYLHRLWTEIAGI